MKQALCSFKMHSEHPVNKQLDEFNKLILNLGDIDVEIEDKHHTELLLCSLPKRHIHFKATLMYGRKSVCLS